MFQSFNFKTDGITLNSKVTFYFINIEPIGVSFPMKFEHDFLIIVVPETNFSDFGQKVTETYLSALESLP